MNKITIRQFLQKDRDVIIRLFFEFGAYLQKLDENGLGLIIVPKNYGEAFYNKMIADVENKQGIIYVAENENHDIVGFIAGVIIKVGDNDEELDCKPHLMGRVIELFITEKYRGSGLGTDLIQKITDYFKDNKCYKINIEVFGLNTKAYQFYKKLGYTERNIDLVKVL